MKNKAVCHIFFVPSDTAGSSSQSTSVSSGTCTPSEPDPSCAETNDVAVGSSSITSIASESGTSMSSKSCNSPAVYNQDTPAVTHTSTMCISTGTEEDFQ